MTWTRRVLASLLVGGMLGSSLPHMVPIAWVDIQPVAWDAPTWADRAAITIPPEPIDAATLSGVHPIGAFDAAAGIQAGALLVPGANLSIEGKRVDDEILEELKELVQEAEERSGERFHPEPTPRRGCAYGSTTMPLEDLLADPTLAPPGGSGSVINCDVVFAVGEMLAIRSRLTAAEAPDGEGTEDRGNGDTSAWSDDTRVHLIDVVEGVRVTPAEFWQEDAREELWSVTVDAIRHDARGISLLPVASDPDGDLLDGILEETVFLPNGGILLTVPAGFHAPELDGLLPDVGEASVGGTPDRMTLQLDEAEFEHLLTPLGAYVRTLASESREFGVPFVWAGERRVDCALIACVALTFDGGPSDVTPVIMNVLAERDAAGTFFVRGERAGSFPDAVWRGFAEGHSMQNGTQTGADLSKLREMIDLGIEITSGRNTVADITGEVPTMLRPGAGDVTKRIVEAARMPAILWTFDAAVTTIDEIAAQVRAGDIVRVPEDADALAGGHDSASGTAMLVEALQARGFELVTVRQLFGGRVPPPGVYEHAR